MSTEENETEENQTEEKPESLAIETEALQVESETKTYGSRVRCHILSLLCCTVVLLGVGYGFGYLTASVSLEEIIKVLEDIDERFKENTIQYKCLFKRCCKERNNITSSDDIKCESLNLYQCAIDHHDVCDWGCDPTDFFSLEFYDGYPMIKVFAGFSQGNGDFPEDELNQTIPIKAKHNAVSDFVSSFVPSDVISSHNFQVYDPECGIIYEYYTSAELGQVEENDADSEKIAGGMYIDNGVVANATNTTRRMLLSIRDADGRTQVTQNLSPAYAQIGYLTFTSSDGLGHRCSGTLISYRVVLTAAHCVWGGDYYSNFKFYPGALSSADINSNNEYRAAAGGVFAFSGYMDGRAHFNYWDIGLIRLDRSPNVGALGFAMTPNSALPSPADLYTSGYPADKPYLTKWTQFCSYDTSGPRFTSTTCDTYGGQSGSSVYSFDNVLNGLYVLAVVSGSDGPNVYCKLNGTVFTRICSFISVTNPTRCG